MNTLREITFFPILPQPLGLLISLVFITLLISIAGFALGNKLKKITSILSVIFSAISLCLSLFALLPFAATVPAFRFNWLGMISGNDIHSPPFSLYLDTQGSLMLIIVLAVAFLVRLYSLGYMSQDPKQGRYFAFIDLFTVAMAMLVLSGNLFTLFIFWELVGLCSYFLVGFWHKEKTPAVASQKAIILNRIGDALFLAGIMVAFVAFGNSEFVHLSEIATRFRGSEWLTISVLLMFGGVMGKSAQFPLQVWLPDAMAGPTPASALIHAATMVAAGIFLLLRISPLVDWYSTPVIAMVGASTTLLAAFSASTQWDIKKVLAYSTISQLGLMVAASGIRATDAAFFHLATHAFFKCGLFLAAGILIHSWKTNTQGENDLRNLSRLSSVPLYFKVILFILLASLSGLPLFSGFLSKENILHAAVNWASSRSPQLGIWVWTMPALLFFTTALTAYYSFRMFFLLNPRQSEKSSDNHFHSGWQMAIPVLLCGLISIAFFWSFPNPLDAEDAWFTHLVKQNYSNESATVFPVVSLSLIMTSLGISVAGYFFWFRKIISVRTAPGAISKLFYYHFFLDFFYENFIVRIFFMISNAYNWVDKKLVDGFFKATAALLFGAFAMRTNISAMTKWWDEKILDGAINAVAGRVTSAGRGLRAIQPAQMQLWLIITIAAMLLLVSALIYFTGI